MLMKIGLDSFPLCVPHLLPMHFDWMRESRMAFSRPNSGLSNCYDKIFVPGIANIHCCSTFEGHQKRYRFWVGGSKHTHFPHTQNRYYIRWWKQKCQLLPEIRPRHGNPKMGNVNPQKDINLSDERKLNTTKKKPKGCSILLAIF